MRRWPLLLAAAGLLVGACAAEDPIEASGCENGVPTDSDEALVAQVTDCDNGRLVTFEDTTRRDAYRLTAELRGAEVLKSGELWLFLEED